MLNDAERVGRILESGLVDDDHVTETMKIFDDRLEVVESSMHSKQPLLSLYRVLIPLLGKSCNKYVSLFKLHKVGVNFRILSNDLIDYLNYYINYYLT